MTDRVFVQLDTEKNHDEHVALNEKNLAREIIQNLLNLFKKRLIITIFNGSSLNGS